MKTSGSKGFHIFVPLEPGTSFRDVARFSASRRCSAGRSAIPIMLTQELAKVDRGGRILIDTGRNGYSATFAAAYAVRATKRGSGVGTGYLGGS